MTFVFIAAAVAVLAIPFFVGFVTRLFEHKHRCADLKDLVECRECGILVKRDRAAEREMRREPTYSEQDDSGNHNPIPESVYFCQAHAPKWDYAIEQNYGPGSGIFARWYYYKRGKDFRCDEKTGVEWYRQ